MRRNDFQGWCQPGIPLAECFAPLSAYARRVDEVRREILDKQGVFVERVLMTSDERDPEWWAKVRALGWLYPDHEAEKTEETLGKWLVLLYISFCLAPEVEC